MQNNPNAEIKEKKSIVPQTANIITDTKIIICFITGAAVNAAANQASLEFYAPVSHNPSRRTKTKLYQEMIQTAHGCQSDEDPTYNDALDDTFSRTQARMMNTPSDEWE